jgi:hypothetical protein
LEVVGLLLWQRLTKRNEISAALPGFGRWNQLVRRKSGEWVVKNVLGKLTASRGTNEDKRTYHAHH